MPTDYQNILTDLVKRVRPLLVGIAQGAKVRTPRFAPALRGWNDTTTAAVDITVSSNGLYGILMNDTDNILAGGYFLTPAGWSGTLTITGIMHTVTHPGAGGEYGYYRNFIRILSYFDPSGVGAGTASASTQVDLTGDAGGHKILPISVTVNKQALVKVYTYRFANETEDTSDYDHYFYGWEIDYS